MGLKKRIVIVANMPTHYRAPVFDLLPVESTTVIYCSRVEPSRRWQMPEFSHHAVFMQESFRGAANGLDFIHNNTEVWRSLNSLKPESVVIGGMNPTHLYAFAWAKMNGARAVYMTDGTFDSELALGWRHKSLRRLLLARFDGHLVSGRGGERLLASYGVEPRKVIVSRLCGPPALDHPPAMAARDFDVLFCGRIERTKMPQFFAAVCSTIRSAQGRCRALVVGEGTLRGEMLASLESGGVETTFRGFLPPTQLASCYASARLLLFPTVHDPWGLVANEALAAGTPVFTTPVAGCAGDLVIDGYNGRVLPPTASVWANAACQVLDDEPAWARMSANACRSVTDFNPAAAAAGILEACGVSRKT